MSLPIPDPPSVAPPPPPSPPPPPPPPRRNRIKDAAHAIADLPALSLLLVGEVIKHKWPHSNRLYIPILDNVQRRSLSRKRLVHALSHLSLGHAQHINGLTPLAIIYLSLAHDNLVELPESPHQQVFLMQCRLLMIHASIDLLHLERALDSATQAKAQLESMAEYVANPGHGWRKLCHRSQWWWEYVRRTTARLSHYLLLLGRFRHGEELQKHVLSRLDKAATPRDGPALYKIDQILSFNLTLQEKYDEAVDVLRRMRARNVARPHLSDSAESLLSYRIAVALSLAGRNEAARDEVLARDLGSDLMHYHHGPAVLREARRIHFRLKEFDQVIRLCTQFQTILDGKFGLWSMPAISSLYDHAITLCKLRRLDESIAVLRQIREREDVWTRQAPKTSIFPVLPDAVSVAGSVTSALTSAASSASSSSSSSSSASGAESSEDEQAPTPPVLISRLHRVDPKFRLRMRLQLARVLRQVGQLDESLFEHRKCLELASQSADKDLKQIRNILVSLAWLYETTGDRPNAAIAYAHLHREYLSRHRDDRAGAMKYFYYRGRMFLLRGQFSHAITLLQYAGEYREALLNKSKARSEPRDTLDADQGEIVNTESGAPQQSTVSTDTRPGTPQNNSETEREIVADSIDLNSGDAHTRLETPHIPTPSGAGDASTDERPAGGSRPRSTREGTRPREVDDLDDPIEFGTVVPPPRPSKGEDWWMATIRGAIAAAKRGEPTQDPVPSDRYDLDHTGSFPEGVEPGTSTLEEFITATAKFPVRPEAGETVLPKFPALPQTYPELVKQRRMRELYAWRL